MDAYFYRAIIVSNLSDDNYKKEYLKDILEYDYSDSIIASINDDEYKKNVLETRYKRHMFQIGRYRIIASLNDEAYKKKCMKNIYSDYGKAIIISGLNDDIEREETEIEIETQIETIKEQEKELAELKKEKSEKLRSAEKSSIGTEQH